MTQSRIYNEDCITGMQHHVESESIDMVFTDPPYGIEGDKTDIHYARDGNFVVSGYVDIPKKEYDQFSQDWITELARVLKPGGSVYIVSGWSNLIHILNALHKTDLQEINHLIAQYSFGVYTKNKWVSSHYHILFWAKKGKRTFNSDAYYLNDKQSYQDRQSVQRLDREYQTGKVRYQNQLPIPFIQKFIAYSSSPGDTILDPFGGSFSTRNAALSLDRNFIGFEINKNAVKEFGDRNDLSEFL